MKLGFIRYCSLWLALCVPIAASAQDEITIYIDADYSQTQHPAEAIEAGLRAAIASHPSASDVRVVTIDNRANARRSNDTLVAARADPTAVAVFGGMHSPHYLVNLEAINQSQMPLLLPWSAAGPLTRGAQGDQNWVFRLSVDDQKAADYLYSVALERGCKRPAAVAVDNTWGRYNMEELQRAANARSQQISQSILLHDSAGPRTLDDAVGKINRDQADCVLLVTGFELGASIIEHLASSDTPPRIISHWGMLGGRIINRFNPEQITALDLEILGTCGLHQISERNAIHAAAMRYGPKGFDPQNHPAPHGYYHAFDLGQLFLQALDHARTDVRWDQGIAAQRDALRRALHRLDGRYEGLITDYHQPFQPVSAQTPDGHEALGLDDLCMTRVSRNGSLEPIFQEQDLTGLQNLVNGQISSHDRDD